MKENKPTRDRGAENANVAQGHDFEYDEAHDVPAGRWVELMHHIESIPRQR